MARPTKQGIDYFPIDVEWDEKHEMYLLEKESNGLSVLVTAWQLIYKNEGYYSIDNNDFYLLIKKRINLDLEVISDCINVGLRRNIFNNALHDKYNILTSKAIQKRFFDAAKKKKIVKVIPSYLLVDVSSFNNLIKVDINDINSCGNATNVEEEEEVKGEVKGKEETGELNFEYSGNYYVLDFNKAFPKNDEERKPIWDAWKKWVDKKFNQRTPLDKDSAIAQLKKLSESSDPIDIINYSIEQNYKGLYERNNNGKSSNSNKQGATADELAEIATNRYIRQQQE